MIKTKENTLEHWLDMRLDTCDDVSQKVQLRNRLDAWFISKGFTPMHRAYGKYYSEYYNEKTRQALYVNQIKYFDDSLLDTNSWVVVSDEYEESYLMPYNALYDFGVMWKHREKHYTDADNSTKHQLIDTLRLIIQFGIAYEL